MQRKKLPSVRSKAAHARSGVDDWQTEVLRLTAFPSPAFQIGEVDWWQKVTGLEAEVRTSQPKKALFQDEGNVEGGRIVLKLEPMRIDWLMSQVEPDDQEVGSEFRPIAQFGEALDLFLKYVRQWFQLGLCPPLQRLAFGAVLLQPAPDRKSGYEKLATYLPAVKIDPERSSDFLYQINRPRPSTSLRGCKINRLSKWTVQMRASHGIRVTANMMQFSKNEARLACRLELDINTTEEFKGPFEEVEVPQVFEELVNLGREIALSGDIP